MKVISKLVTPGSLVVFHNIRIMSSTSGMVESTIREKLQTALDATHINIVNESYMHNVPKEAETHFKVIVVSNKFEGLTLLKRHRLVNDILRDELKSKIHALSIVAKSQQQWDESDKAGNGSVLPSALDKDWRGICPAVDVDDDDDDVPQSSKCTGVHVSSSCVVI